MPADFDGVTCPYCGAPTLVDGDERWCSRVGTSESCVGDSGNMRNAMMTPEERTAAWAQFEALRAALPETEWVDIDAELDDAAPLRLALAEQSALLALWSSGAAGTLPEGWTPAADRVPSLERDLGRLTAEVERDGGWFIWRNLKHPDDDAEVLERHPGPRPILVACAEATERLAQMGASDAP